MIWGVCWVVGEGCGAWSLVSSTSVCASCGRRQRKASGPGRGRARIGVVLQFWFLGFGHALSESEVATPCWLCAFPFSFFYFGHVLRHVRALT